ncbi:MAG: hypothetical protein R2754_14065 [Microthrixaceae bacterium]
MSTLWGAALMDLPADSSARISPYLAATADVDVSTGYFVNAKNIDFRVREGWGTGFIAVRGSTTPGVVDVVENDGTTDTTLGSFPAPTQGRMRLRVEGGNVKARTWGYDDPEPATWNVDTTTSRTDAGWVSINASTDSSGSGAVLLDDIKVAPNNGEVPLAGWDYDNQGRLNTATVGSGSRSWQWDHYRPTQQTLTAFGGSQSVTRAYDTTGRIVSTTDTLDGTTTYTYDQASQLVSAAGPGARDWDYTYLPGGRRHTTDGPAGETTYRWDTNSGSSTKPKPPVARSPFVWDSTGGSPPAEPAPTRPPSPGIPNNASPASTAQTTPSPGRSTRTISKPA